MKDIRPSIIVSIASLVFVGQTIADIYKTNIYTKQKDNVGVVSDIDKDKYDAAYAVSTSVVRKFNGRKNNVTPQAGDYSPMQVFGNPTGVRYPQFNASTWQWKRPLEACGSNIETAVFDGKNATFRCSSTTTLPAGAAALVRNDGTPSDGILKFSIPAGATGPQGRPAIFCTLSTSVRAASYDSSGLNPAPSLTSIVLQMWNGAVRIVADAYTWWTGGTGQRVYGSGSGTGSNSFTPSLKSVFSNISNNSYVMVQGRYSSATTGKQYCTTGFAYAITRAGVKGDKGEPGNNASVDWASVKAAAGTKNDEYFGLQQNTANKNKLVLIDELSYGRLLLTGDGKITHVDRNSVARFLFNPSDFSFQVNNASGNPVIKAFTDNRTEFYTGHNSKAMTVYSSGRVVIGG